MPIISNDKKNKSEEKVDEGWYKNTITSPNNLNQNIKSRKNLSKVNKT